MNEDRVVGAGKNFAGQVEDAYGRATGNVRREVEGKARQAEGTAQDLYGQVKDKPRTPRKRSPRASIAPMTSCAT